MAIEDVMIIGSGPAGFTAALYTARANLNPLMITGDQIGGQVSITHEVENYPGFPEGISGPDLVMTFQKQAERFGARIEYDMVTGVDFSDGPPFTIHTQNGKDYRAWSVIISAGASAKKLAVPGEDDYIGRGVSYCGTCDGFFFRDKKIVVVGGGDSALEEGIFLTKFATDVNVLHRRDELRAGAILQNRAFKNEKMGFTWDTVIEEIAGEDTVTHVKVRNRKTGATSSIDTDGVFIFIGHYPNTGFLGDAVMLDEAGYVITDDHMMTNVEGVFAAGEIQDPIWRQVATSVGQGAAAGMAVTRWLEEHEDAFKEKEAALSAD